ncbi:hypothetical protein [uncultured Herbaspirillum sp.]|uniref:hypothetical protein n=1 Tax=uncultured Herbaspirillum sp. TaxID=160236 RepID=UPI002584D39D|nr:hypothetical protein [uncultured Herbaspirillum sp.]
MFATVADVRNRPGADIPIGIEEKKMTLLTKEEIVQGLELKYREDVQQFPTYFNGVIPKAATKDQEREISAEIFNISGIKAPDSFREMLREWDLGDLKLLNFRFGNGGSFSSALRKMNTAPDGLNWWGDRAAMDRPNGLLMVAQGDPDIVLLDVTSGEILTFIADLGSSTAKTVAPSISQFFRGLGSISLMNPSIDDVEGFTASLANAVGININRSFWRILVDQWKDFAE